MSPANPAILMEHAEKLATHSAEIDSLKAGQLRVETKLDKILVGTVLALMGILANIAIHFWK